MEGKHMRLDPQKTATLTLDFQKGILDMVQGSEAVLPVAAKAVAFGRSQGFSIIHVGMGFSEGHPEIPDMEYSFARIKRNNLFVKGSASAEFHPSIVRPGDLIVHKQRVGAFSENQLHLILRARGIANLVFFGVATSGIVLSTLRRAFDLDFHCVVLKNACYDADLEVHRVLTEKVFPRQAAVSELDAFISGQGND